MFIIFMQGQSSPERVEFIPVPIAMVWIVRLGIGFALSKFDHKRLPSYSNSALYVLVPDTILVLFW